MKYTATYYLIPMAATMIAALLMASNLLKRNMNPAIIAVQVKLLDIRNGLVHLLFARGLETP